MATPAPPAPPPGTPGTPGKPKLTIKRDEGKVPNAEAQNSFSANSPFFTSYVENEVRSMAIMNDTLRDISGRTKTFSKCGALMSEATRRLALACRLRRPYIVSEDQKEMETQEQRREREVAERRRAVGEDMTSLLAVMSEVSEKMGSLSDLFFTKACIQSICCATFTNRCWTKLRMLRSKCANPLRQLLLRPWNTLRRRNLVQQSL